MQFYELPGMLVNPDHVIVVNTANDKAYILLTVSGGEHHLSAEQTEAFKKLSEKDGKSDTLSLRKRKEDDAAAVEYGEGAVHPPVNETFVPPIAQDHPLNDANFGKPPANQSLDVSISLPEITGKVIDASEDRDPATNTIDANAPAKESKAKADSKDKDKDSK